MSHHEQSLDPADTQPLGSRALPAYRALVITGLIGLIIALAAALISEDSFRQGLQRFSFAYLLSFVFVLSIALGLLFFVMITHLFRAGWSVLVRRPAELFAANMPVLLIMFLPILAFVLANNGMLYKWAQPLSEMGEAANGSKHAATDHQIILAADVGHGASTTTHNGASHNSTDRTRVAPQDIGYISSKRPWLNIPFWIIRCLGYLTIWSAFGAWYLRHSVLQDQTADPTLTNKMERAAPAGVLIFALTITWGAFDIIMALDPVWYSTIFGVYFFAGCFGGAIATLILTLMGLQKLGQLRSVTVEHYHDLGKLQFAFVFFWGYIAFSQFMLIWYANLPATTYWFENRGASTAQGATNGWTWVSLLLLFGNLLIPFAGLLSRHVKRNRRALGFWAIWLLVMHWVDLWWLVMPQLSLDVKFPFVEFAAVVGLAGLFLAGVVRKTSVHRLVASGDPRLGESLAFENM